MSFQKVPINQIAEFVPENSVSFLLKQLQDFNIKLKIVSERKTILGTYTFDNFQKRHVITINANLNKYLFLTTLLHEIAHLIVYVKYPNQRVSPHGKEWKMEYQKILSFALAENFFPEDIQKAIEKSLHKISFSSCTDIELYKALRKYDANNESKIYVESIQINETFKLKDGREFLNKGRKVKRYLCEEVRTGKLYYFHPLYEVKKKEA